MKGRDRNLKGNAHSKTLSFSNSNLQLVCSLRGPVSHIRMRLPTMSRTEMAAHMKDLEFKIYCDMYTHCPVTAVSTGDSTTSVAREQPCGDVSPATREHAIMEETFSVRSVTRLYNEDQPPLRDCLETAVRRVGGSCEVAAMIESADSCSCEKWEAGSWNRGQFWNQEEGDHQPWETATKQRQVKTEKTLCVP
jgi:hypothetical protein